MTALAVVPVLAAMVVTGVPEASAGTGAVRIRMHTPRTAPLQPSVMTGHIPADRPRPIRVQMRRHGHWETQYSTITSNDTGFFHEWAHADRAVGHVRPYRVLAPAWGHRRAVSTPAVTLTTVNPTRLVSRWPTPQDAYGAAPQMSPDGRYIYYASSPSMLVDRATGTHTRIRNVRGGRCDLKYFDWDSHKNRVVPANPFAAELAAHPSYAATCGFHLHPVVSRNGRFHLMSAVLYDTADGARKEAELLRYDSRQRTWRTLPVRPFGSPPVSDATTTIGLDDRAVSDDGSKVVFTASRTTTVEGDRRTELELFLYDADTDTTALVTHTRDGSASAMGPGSLFAVAITADGSRVFFVSSSTDLLGGRGLIGYDVATSALTLVKGTDDAPTTLVTSATGRTFAWDDGPRLAYFKTKPRHVRYVRYPTRNLSGALPTRGLEYPTLSMSADGRLLAFDSQHVRLVAHTGTPGHQRVYLFNADI